MDELTELPKSFVAGDTVEYRRTFSDFPANDGWTLEAFIRGEKTINATVTTDGADFLVSYSATDTAKLDKPGIHKASERVTKAGKSYTIWSSPVDVSLNLSTAVNGEAQSWNERVLAALKDRYLGRVFEDLEAYGLPDNVTVARIPFDSLPKHIANFDARVAAERRGGAPRPPIHATFTPLGSS